MGLEKDQDASPVFPSSLSGDCMGVRGDGSGCGEYNFREVSLKEGWGNDRLAFSFLLAGMSTSWLETHQSF